MGKRGLRRRFFSFSLALCMILTLFPVPTRATVYEGDCGADGANVQWAFDDETGVLTITGSGPMADYPSQYNTPWTDYHEHSITSVQIGEGVTNVGKYAFAYCYDLTDINLPDSVTSVGEYAFCCCDALSSLTIPGSVKRIEKDAFNSCNSLSSITFSEGVESIGYTAFSGCQVSSLTIPSSVKRIEHSAFSSCNNLSSVTLSKGLESMDYTAFSQCYKLSSLTIPSSVKEFSYSEYEYSNFYTPTPTVYFDTYAWRFCLSNNLACNVLEGDGKTYTAVGECGADGAEVYWKLDDSGLLTISGSGAMSDFDSYYSGPWRDWHDDIKTVEIQSGVTSVGNYAFYNSWNYYPNLTAVSLPDKLTSIGNSAFYNCAALESVTIPADVTTIENGAFGNCEKLTLTVTEQTPGYGYALRDNIPFKLAGGGDTVYDYDAGGQCGENVYWTLDDGTLTIFGSGAMESAPMVPDRNSVNTLEIKSGVTKIGDSAFNDFDSVKSVTIPDSVTEIGSNAFYNCDALTSVTFPANLVSIGDYAFYYCQKLASLSLPSKLASIGNYAFSDCDALVTVTLPNSVTSVGDHAFYNCDALASLTLSANLASIGDYAFQYCYAIRNLTLPDKVSEIGKYAFQSCNRLSALTIPATVKTIGEGAFRDCGELLLTVTQDSGGHIYALGDGVPFKLAGDTSGAVRVGGKCGENVSWLLDWKSGLLEITGSGDMTSYPWSSYTDKIKTVTIGSGVTSVCDYAFNSCSSLTSVTLPDSLTSIGYQSFYNCSNLASLVIPGNVSSIGSYAFQYCYALASVTLPANLTKIEAGTFYECNALASVTIPDKVQSIDREAFYSCDALESATVPASVVSIDDSAFSGCPNVVLTVTENSEAYNYATRNNISHRFSGSDTVYHQGSCGAGLGDDVTWVLDSDGLLTIKGSGAMQEFGSDWNIPWRDLRNEIKSVSVGSGVTSIGSYAFYDCDALTSITIGDSVTSIGDQAFSNCDALASVKISASVTSISGYAFYNCDALTSVTIPDTVTSIGVCAFSDCEKLVLTVTENKASYTCALRDGVRFRFADAETTYRGGYCGSDNSDSVIWVLDSDGLLTIKGSGAMQEFGSDWNIPWRDLRNEIKSVSVGSGVTSIGSYAFYDCDALASVTIADGVKSIGDYAFAYSDKFTSVAFPASVTSIGSGAFYNCGALASVTLPDTVTSIGSIAFNDCANLILTVTEKQASYTCALRDGVRFRFADAETTYRGGYCGSDNNSDSVVWLLDSNGLFTIKGSGAMREFGWYGDRPWENFRGDIKSVSIASGVTTVSPYAFYNCDALASVTIGDSVTSIGSNAFYNCDAFASVTIPDSVTSIGYEAFRACDALKSIPIPSTVKEIGEYAFSDCPNLILTVTKDSAAHKYAVSNYTRYRLTGSDTVYMNWGNCGKKDENGNTGDKAQWVFTDDGLLKISGSGAMSDWNSEWDVSWLDIRDSVRSVEIEKGITRIGNYAFYECKNLASVTIPESVTSIGECAFYNCAALSALTLHGNVAEIGGNAFYNCAGLVVTVPDNSATRQAVGKAFIAHKLPGSETVYLAFGLWGAESSQAWTLESNGILTLSGTGAVTDYDNSASTPWASVRERIRTVIVKDGVTQVGSYAFAEYGSLEKVFLAAGVKTIGERAFYNNQNLTSVSLEEGLNSIGANAFFDCAKLATLTVPESVTSIGAEVFNNYSDTPLNLTVYSGSDAENYAEANGIPYTVITRGAANVSGVTLNESSLTLSPGQTFLLSASVQPDDAQNKKVTWSSDNSAVASVDEHGIVRAVSEGSANITVTTDDGGKTASCTIAVMTRIPASVIVLNVSRKALKVGGEFDLTATVFPENASDKTVTWSTSDEQIASIYKYEDYYGYGPNTIRVKKEGSGTAVITAHSADGSIVAECEILDHLAVTGVRIDKKSVILKQGGEDTLSATVLPEGASNENVSWSCSDYNIAEVSEDGKVTGKTHGKATLIATTEDGGFTAFCLVEVTNEVTNVEGITLNREKIPSLEFGTSMQLVATITPTNATNQAIMWTSSAPEVVAVSDDGVVTAFETGKTAVITAMTADGGYRASCVVTVSDSRTPTELRVYAPGNLTAVQGSPLNLAGVSVEAVYGDLSEYVSDYSVYDYNRDRVGAQTVVISYKGKSASLDVTVIERYAERLLIAQSPDKREYAVGEELDLSGLILQAEYNDQTLETVTDISTMAAVGFRSDAAGVYPVTVKWNDLYSSAFYVTILSKADESVTLTAPKMNIVGYPGGKRVELSAVPGAEIRYEIGENSVPSFDSTLYQEPVLCKVNGTTVIKAVAILDGETSAITTSRVFVDQVEPLVASHDDNAQLPAGTLVTLRTPTDGATIRYTTDGSEPTTSSPLYSSGVLVNADMTLRAIAVKDGARNSETFEASYKAESRTDAQSAATISIASVTSRAGERASMPVYLFTDGGEKVTSFRFAINFDRRAFEFVSVSPAEGISASNLMVSSGANSGKVTVMYDAGDGSAIGSGEAFTLTLRALDSSEDGAYDIRLSSEDGITIKTGSASPLVNQTPGVITLSGSNNSQLTGEISLQDADGNTIDALQAEQDQINVSFSLDPYAAQSDSALTAMADVYLVLYDDKGLMLDIQTWNIELKNVWLAFSQVKQVPPEIKGKIDKIKIMILSEDMTPIMAASEL